MDLAPIVIANNSNQTCDVKIRYKDGTCAEESFRIHPTSQYGSRSDCKIVKIEAQQCMNELNFPDGTDERNFEITPNLNIQVRR